MLRNVQHFPLIDGAAPRYLAASLAASTANVRLLIARPLYTTICIAYVVNSWSLYIYMYTCPSILELATVVKADLNVQIGRMSNFRYLVSFHIFPF